jgi:hypothetical protein
MKGVFEGLLLRSHRVLCCCRYALNVYFNLLNKSIFKYFPFPYTVSTVHVVVGTVYCVAVYLLGLRSWSFGRVSRQELRAVQHVDFTLKPVGPYSSALQWHLMRLNFIDACVSTYAA